MSYLSLVGAFALVGLAAFAGAAASRPSVNEPLVNWAVLGPLPNPLGEGANARRLGHDTDYFKAIGGEANLRLEVGREFAVSSEFGGAVKLTAVPAKIGWEDTIDFMPLFKVTDYQVAYAYTEFESPAAEEGLILLGSDDSVKVWLNGKLVWDNYFVPGRGFRSRSDHIRVRYNRGVNRLLVKVENGVGGWSFAAEVFGAKQGRALIEEANRADALKKFREEWMVPTNRLYMAAPGETVTMNWAGPDTVKALIGERAVKTRIFDADGAEVTKLEKPGRYMLWGEVKLENGFVARRSATLFVRPEEIHPWEIEFRIDAAYPGAPFKQEQWQADHAASVSVLQNALADAFWSSEPAMLYLLEMWERSNGVKPAAWETSVTRNDDYHLKIKLQMMGVAGKTKPLAPPKTLVSPARSLRLGSEEEAGLKPGSVAKLDAICREWATRGGQPFSVVVARHGVVALHGAYGARTGGEAIDESFRNSIASISKALTGLLFARLVDQGLVKIDDPIGLYVPGYPTRGPKALTFRHLFTHTNGLVGHMSFGGVHNPVLDNVILGGLDALPVGKVHWYNGDGYNLAGKAMEYRTGSSISRLFHEGLYNPLGIPKVDVADLATGHNPTAWELAILAQMLLNKGRYGDKEYFSEATFEQLLPRDLEPYFPAIRGIEWGIGLTWMRVPKEGVTKPSKPEDWALGPNVIGHGSATSCVFHVALDHDLFITMVRQGHGVDYDKHLSRFETAIAESLK